MVNIGDGATFTVYTDKIACTVVDIRRNGKEIDLQEDNSIRIDHNGMSEVQEYNYSRNINGRIFTVTLRKNKAGEIVFKEKGVKTSSTGCYARFGVRRTYHDYSF